MRYFVDDSEGMVPVDFFIENNEGVEVVFEELDEITGLVIESQHIFPDGSEVSKRPRRKYQGARPIPMGKSDAKRMVW